ncbi:MAG: ketosteroid isomerase-like protein [Halioglobus sp.]|jgi:ketosteroid isomerase-like protein
MGAQRNRELLTQWYTALEQGDWETIGDMHADDVVYYMVGSTPVSGKLEGKDECLGEMINKKLLGQLVPEEVRFSQKWRIMCVDDHGGVGVMEGGGPTVSGDMYYQTYCEIFRFENDKIKELHAFFDTALVERCLFGNHLQQSREQPKRPFDF